MSREIPAWNHEASLRSASSVSSKASAVIVVFVVELVVVLERMAADNVLLRRRLANIFGLEFAVVRFEIKADIKEKITMIKRPRDFLIENS